MKLALSVNVEALLAERATAAGLSIQEMARVLISQGLGLSGWTVPSAPAGALAGRDVPGFVYLFGHGRETHLFKIGFSSNPERRRLEVERTEDCSVELLATIPTGDMRRLESELHREYSMKRIRGEWFQLTERDVEAIRRLAERQS